MTFDPDLARCSLIITHRADGRGALRIFTSSAAHLQHGPAFVLTLLS